MILLSTLDPCVRLVLARHLTACGLPFRHVAPAALQGRASAATTACVCSRTYARAAPRLPTVVICHGVHVPHDAWMRPPPTGTVFLARENLTSERLLRAILRARLGGNPGRLAAAFPGIPLRLVAAFLTAPRRLRRLPDLAVALQLSRQASQRLIRETGASRFEHWRTRMLAAAWRLLNAAGVRRAVIARYLGIKDRSNFRRACRRAACLPPWVAQTRGGKGRVDATGPAVVRLPSWCRAAMRSPLRAPQAPDPFVRTP